MRGTAADECCDIQARRPFVIGSSAWRKRWMRAPATQDQPRMPIALHAALLIHILAAHIGVTRCVCLRTSHVCTLAPDISACRTVSTARPVEFVGRQRVTAQRPVQIIYLPTQSSGRTVGEAQV